MPRPDLTSAVHPGWAAGRVRTTGALARSSLWPPLGGATQPARPASRAALTGSWPQLPPPASAQIQRKSGPATNQLERPRPEPASPIWSVARRPPQQRAPGVPKHPPRSRIPSVLHQPPSFTAHRHRLATPHDNSGRNKGTRKRMGLLAPRGKLPIGVGRRRVVGKIVMISRSATAELPPGQPMGERTQFLAGAGLTCSPMVRRRR